MKKGKLELRRELFWQYARNAALYLEDVEGHCPCPVCGNAYNEPAIRAEHLALDLAHVYPSASGGGSGPVVLTCKPCNSRIGTAFDSHVAQDLKIIQAFDGSGTGFIDARLHFPNGTSMGATVQNHGGHFSFKSIPKQTNPAIESKIGEYLRSGTVSMQIDFKQPDPDAYRVSFLHSAYLAMYWYFGWEYCLYGNSKWVRDILCSPGAPRDIPFITFEVPPDELKVPIESLLFTPCVALTSSRKFALAVAFPSAANIWAVRIALLPGFGGQAMEDYLELVATREMRSKQPLRVAVDFFPPEQRLANEEFVWYGHQWWRMLCERLEG